jgi:hypothetical protein
MSRAFLTNLVAGLRAMAGRRRQYCPCCAPRLSIASKAHNNFPLTAPRHPAWAAATTPAFFVGQQYRGNSLLSTPIAGLGRRK